MAELELDITPYLIHVELLLYAHTKRLFLIFDLHIYL